MSFRRADKSLASLIFVPGACGGQPYRMQTLMVFFYWSVTLTDLTLTDANADAEIRATRVTIWLNVRETETIDLKRGHYNRASFLRAAGLDRELVRAPDPVCREQWGELGHFKGNLAQLVKHLNLAAHMEGLDRGAREALNKIDEINPMLDELRAWLAGVVVTTVKAG